MEFDMPSGKLRHLLSLDGAPKFVIHSATFSCHTRYYIAADLRAWVAAHKEKK
jgi:hypothetical protein